MVHGLETLKRINSKADKLPSEEGYELRVSDKFRIVCGKHDGDMYFWVQRRTFWFFWSDMSFIYYDFEGAVREYNTLVLEYDNDAV